MRNIQNKKTKTKKRILKGFSLLEMLVSIMIFSLVTLVSVAAFSSVVKTQRKVRNIQKKVESVGLTVELISKVIRMSSQVKSYSNGVEIRMYNDSQSKCISYRFFKGNLQESEKFVTDYDPSIDTTCTSSGAYNNYIDIISGVTGRFQVNESDPGTGKVGKATVTIRADQDHLQSSVSFTDAY